MDLGGSILHDRQCDNQGYDRVYLTAIDDSERSRSIRHRERP